jgi:2,6-dihydroxypseudooxynicotine hydrolase
MTDPRIEAAVSHWAPRYVENGVPVGDFLEVTGSIDSWDEWCSAWSACGAIHEAEGDRALSQGRTRSAASHFNTAAVCYHFGKFLFTHDLVQMKAAHQSAIRAHRKAHPLFAEPVERLEIPFGDGPPLVGNLRKPIGIETPPIVLMMPGLDSAKEELSTNEQFYLDRGMATFTMDGPGQGESEFDYPITPTYEVAAAAAIDVLEARDDLDTDRLGAWGVSMGGFYVVRAACFEKRIKALVSLSGPFRVVDSWDILPPMSLETWRVRTHSETLEEAYPKAELLDLTKVIHQVTCPAYIMGGDQDRIVPPAAAHEMADGITGPVTLNIIKGGNHVASNKAYLYRHDAADWMARHLGARG